MKIIKGNTVLVKVGKDKGKTGVVKSVDSKSSKIIVEGVNISLRHIKPQYGQVGDIVKKEMPISISNVELVSADAQVEPKKAIKKSTTSKAKASTTNKESKVKK